MNNEFVIDGIVVDKGLTIEELETKWGVKAVRSGTIARVNFAPKKVNFGTKQFGASFIFSREKLRKIVLMPIMEEIEVPNYPDKDYQNKKKLYCTRILEELYGENFFTVNDGVEWRFEGRKIGCYVINEGRDKYTGGDIVIQFEE